jgi:tRNA (cmo5U34)-methyltransferase
VSQYHFDPETYLDLIHEDVPAYDELQARIAGALAGRTIEIVLDLGAGTGETTRRVREVQPEARIVAVDESETMLARIVLPDVEARVQRLQEPLPPGPFDAVVSALAVHHLDAGEKRALFARIRDVLHAGGRFVLGDVVVADTEVAPLSDGYDKPDRALDQLRWLREAGFDARIDWERDDLALLVADRM